MLRDSPWTAPRLVPSSVSRCSPGAPSSSPGSSAATRPRCTWPRSWLRHHPLELRHYPSSMTSSSEPSLCLALSRSMFPLPAMMCGYFTFFSICGFDCLQVLTTVGTAHCSDCDNTLGVTEWRWLKKAAATPRRDRGALSPHTGNYVIYTTC